MHKFIYKDEELQGNFDALQNEIDPNGSGSIVDNGIGYYEYGSQTGVHHDYGVEMDEDISADVEIVIHDADMENSILDDPKEAALLFITEDCDISRTHTYEPPEPDFEECSRSAARAYDRACAIASSAEFELNVFDVKYVKNSWFKRLLGKKGTLTFSIGWE